MVKKKKISFSYQLNTKVSPQKGEDGKFRFPIYIKILFDRRSTRFPLESFYYYNSVILHATEAEFNELVIGAGKLKELDIWEERFSDLIRYEYKKFGKSYSIIGIADRLKIYFKPLSNLIEYYFYDSFIQSLGDHISYNFFIETQKYVELEYARYALNEKVNKLSFILEKVGKSIAKDVHESSVGLVPFIEFCHFDDELSIHVEKSILNFFTLYDWIFETKVKTGFKKFLIRKDRTKEFKDRDIWTIVLEGLGCEKNETLNKNKIMRELSKAVISIPELKQLEHSFKKEEE